MKKRESVKRKNLCKGCNELLSYKRPTWQEENPILAAELAVVEAAKAFDSQWSKTDYKNGITYKLALKLSESVQFLERVEKGSKGKATTHRGEGL